MPYGAGYVAAIHAGAASLVDPRDSATPDIAAVFARYPHIGPVLPAMGYGAEQLSALRGTIAASGADVIVAATPIDLAAAIDVPIPVVRARYEFVDVEDPGLAGLVDGYLDRHGLGG